MPKFQPQTPVDGLPGNPYNPHLWIVGEPEIGEGCWIGAFVLLDGQGGLTIGKGCNISNNSCILTHSTVKRTVTERAWPIVDRKPTVIGDWVFVGVNSVIQMGCVIGHHSVIGAGTVVKQDTIIPPYSLVVGNPGRIVRSIEKDVESWTADGAALIHNE